MVPSNLLYPVAGEARVGRDHILMTSPCWAMLQTLSPLTYRDLRADDGRMAADSGRRSYDSRTSAVWHHKRGRCSLCTQPVLTDTTGWMHGACAHVDGCSRLHITNRLCLRLCLARVAGAQLTSRHAGCRESGIVAHQSCSVSHVKLYSICLCGAVEDAEYLRSPKLHASSLVNARGRSEFALFPCRLGR